MDIYVRIVLDNGGLEAKRLSILGFSYGQFSKISPSTETSIVIKMAACNIPQNIRN